MGEENEQRADDAKGAHAAQASRALRYADGRCKNFTSAEIVKALKVLHKRDYAGVIARRVARSSACSLVARERCPVFGAPLPASRGTPAPAGTSAAHWRLPYRRTSSTSWCPGGAPSLAIP